MIFYLIIYYAIGCIVFAYYNAKWIAGGKPIKHGINGSIHIVAAVSIGYFTHWYHVFTALLVARVFFDWSLSLFRHLSLGYVSDNPKSIADRIEKWMFKYDGITPKIIYIFLIIVLVNL